jgi:hypothetical protein
MPNVNGKKFPYTTAGKAAAKKAMGMKDGGSSTGRMKRSKKISEERAKKREKFLTNNMGRESGAAFTMREIEAQMAKELRGESGAVVTKAEMKAKKKAHGFKMGGAATKNKRAPSSSNCGLYGRVQGKMGGGKMKPIGMKGGGMPNIGKNNLRRP